MNNTLGFSLTEVLVSLLLMTGTSLALLQQQWQVRQLFNQIHLRTAALTLLDSASESLIAGYSPPLSDTRFQLTKLQDEKKVTLQIAWKKPSAQVANSSLVRELPTE